MTSHVLRKHLATSTEGCLGVGATAGVIGGLLRRMDDPAGAEWAMWAAIVFAAATVILTAATCVCRRIEAE